MTGRVESETAHRSRSDSELEASIKDLGDLKAALDEHAIVAITDPMGRITYVTDRFRAISQFTRGELIGRNHRHA